VTSSSAAAKDRRLGKGLAALLGTPLDEDGVPIPEAGGEGAAGIQTLSLPVDQIENNPFQPRREFNPEEIASLAESIKNHQQLQPILVRIVDGKYQLISGERRLRAAIHAGLDTIRAELREADDRLVAELAIIENLQRKDLNPIEKALSFKRYIEEHQCKQEDLARRLSIDRSTIANLMRLLELPDGILDLLQRGELTAGHARALLPIGNEDQGGPDQRPSHRVVGGGNAESGRGPRDRPQDHQRHAAKTPPAFAAHRSDATRAANGVRNQSRNQKQRPRAGQDHDSLQRCRRI